MGFEKSWRVRLAEERADLVGRLNKLQGFIVSDRIAVVRDEQKELLYAQERAMKEYLRVLDERLRIG